MNTTFAAEDAASHRASPDRAEFQEKSSLIRTIQRATPVLIIAFLSDSESKAMLPLVVPVT